MKSGYHVHPHRLYVADQQCQSQRFRSALAQGPRAAERAERPVNAVSSIMHRSQRGKPDGELLVLEAVHGEPLLQLVRVARRAGLPHHVLRRPVERRQVTVANATRREGRLGHLFVVKPRGMPAETASRLSTA